MSGVLPDWMIERDIKIIPFAPQQARPGIISYGVTSYGYDVRVDRHFKVFTNARCTIVDPKNFDRQSFVDIEGDHCLIPPNSFALAETIEYLEIPRDIIGVCLGKSTYARCFRGDTRVALADGTSATLEDMAASSANGGRYRGYSVAPSGQIIVSRLREPRFIGVDALIAISLDNGETIHATPDHLFLLADGRMCQAQFLRPKVELMAFDREQNRSDSALAIGKSYSYPGQILDCWGRPNETLMEIEKSTNFCIALASTLRYKQTSRRRWEEVELQSDRNLIAIAPLKRESSPGKNSAQSAVERLDPSRHDLSFAEVGMTRFNQSQSDFPGHGTKHGPLRNNKAKIAATVTKVRDLPGTHDVYCLTVPEAGNFALQAGVFVHNCGIICNVTPLEPEWRGRITIEISNTTPLPAKIYSGEGIAQILFFRGEELCKTSYADKKGKYQDQPGLTLPFVPRSEENGT